MRKLLLALGLVGAIVMACSNNGTTYSESGVVGNWLWIAQQFGNTPETAIPLNRSAIYTFNADGSFKYQDLLGNAYPGSYTFDGSKLKISASGSSIEFPAAVKGDRLELTYQQYSTPSLQVYSRKSSEEVATLLNRR